MTMHVDIYSKGIELTDALREYVFDRMSHVQKYTERPDAEMHAYVEIKKNSGHHKTGTNAYHASARFVVDGHEYFAETSHEDMYAAVDTVRDHLYREIRDKKGKRESMFRRGKNLFRRVFRRSI